MKHQMFLVVQAELKDLLDFQHHILDAAHENKVDLKKVEIKPLDIGPEQEHGGVPRRRL